MLSHNLLFLFILNHRRLPIFCDHRAVLGHRATGRLCLQGSASSHQPLDCSEVAIRCKMQRCEASDVLFQNLSSIKVKEEKPGRARLMSE